MTLALETLNENQHKAVSWNDGPLLVLAGPGSGKTRVLAFRVARILEENDDTSALALTFTNKAAAEMRERVERLLGQRADRAHLCTFHSFAVDILRQHGSHLGLRPDFSLLTQDEDRIAVLEDVVAGLTDEGDPLPSDRRNLLRFVDRLFAESYDGGEKAASLARTPTWASPLHRGYCEALVSGNRLDFGSLLHFACRLLQEKPGVARLVRLGWTHVCVDEFQDTNKAQYDLLRLIVPEKRHNLFVVGGRRPDHLPVEWCESRTARAVAAGLRHGRRSAPGVLPLSAIHHRTRQPLDCPQRQPGGEQACPEGVVHRRTRRSQRYSIPNVRVTGGGKPPSFQETFGAEESPPPTVSYWRVPASCSPAPSRA